MSFNKHVGVMSSEYDSTFRFLCGMEEVIDQKTGAVDEPIGHLTMVTIDNTNEMQVHDALHQNGLEIVSAGLYIVHENEMGMVVAFRYETESDRESDWTEAEGENEKVLTEWGVEE